LEGKIAGLEIAPPAAGAGASNKIRLRGQASFAGGNVDNAPLLVINGLPMGQGARGANGTGNQTDQGDNLLLINPDDIESMTVLKGSVAAALYGSRAGNGAIIITTKNGSKSQGGVVEFISSYNMDEVIDLTDFQYEYGQGQAGLKPTSQANAQTNGQFGFGARYDGVPTVQFDGVLRPYSPQKNRVKEFFRKGNTYTNTIAFSAGDAKRSFRASYTRKDAQGIVPNNNYGSHIFNLGVNYSLNDKLSVQVNVNYTNEKNSNPPFVGSQGAGYVNFLYRMAPNIPLSAFKESAFDANGNETKTTNFNTTLLNPYFDMVKRFNRTKRDRLLTTATVRYEPVKWLYLQGRANMDYNNSFNDFNTPTGGGNVSNVSLNSAGTGYTGDYTVNTGSGRELNLDFLVGTNQHFGNFTVDVSAGGNARSVDGRFNSQSAINFVVRDLYTLGNGLPDQRINAANSYGPSRRKVNSLYGFVDFGYKNFAYVNITAREDWFSVLNPENNHFFYPSFSGSLVFSELLKNISWLNYGKLRGGYSIVGSENGVGPYEGVLTYSIGSFGSYILGNLPANNPNPKIEPFRVSEGEIGLELKTLHNRVNLDLSVYNRITDKQIVSVPNSSASGYGSTKINYGKLRNRGAEVLLEFVPLRTKNFNWTSSFNTGYNKTKVLALAPNVNNAYVAQFNDGAELFGAISNSVGKEMNQITGRTYLRNAKGEILVTSSGGLRSTTSDVLFGSALPKYTGGWNNVFSYKKISLLVFIDYKAGGKMLSGTALNGLRQGFSKASLVGRRQGETGVLFPGVYDNGTANTSVVTNLQSFYGNYRSLNILDPFVFKSDFIKLRNITISYDFTSLVGSKLKFVKGLSLAASCRNVAIIKKYVPDIDPESVQSSGDFRVGYEQSALPTNRTYGVNLNVKF
jgi:TonB-linked SusC/RagA family outer membrane protein